MLISLYFIGSQVGQATFHVKALDITNWHGHDGNNELDVHAFLLKLCTKQFVLATSK